jgi:SulP family sulfate permease
LLRYGGSGCQAVTRRLRAEGPAPALYWGVLAGVMMGLLHFLHHRLHPRIIEVGRHPDGSLRDRHLWHLPPLAPHIYALRMDAELDFAAARGFERAIVEHLATHPDVRHVCLFVQPINRIDATGVETFGQIRQQLLARGITLHISGIKLPVETVLRHAGELPEGPMLKLYRTDTETLAALGACTKTRPTWRRRRSDGALRAQRPPNNSCFDSWN